MTVRQKIEDTLVEHGLWEDEAKKVVAEAEKDEGLSAMQGRWDGDITGYPVSVLSVTWTAVKHLAVEWLKANKPEHFALHVLTA